MEALHEIPLWFNSANCGHLGDYQHLAGKWAVHTCKDSLDTAGPVFPGHRIHHMVDCRSTVIRNPRTFLIDILKKAVLTAKLNIAARGYSSTMSCSSLRLL